MKLPKISRIVGKRIVLRRLRISDIPSIVENANDRMVARYMENLPYPYKIKDAKKWIHKTWKDKSGYTFGITLKGEDKVIGGTGLHRFEKRSNFRIAETGYWIGRKYWRQGYGTETALLILDFAFRRLNLKKVYARAFGPNVSSQNLLKKIGFREEGKLRKHRKYRFGNTWLNEHYFGILREEWKRSRFYSKII